jgi:hypothetical protein
LKKESLELFKTKVSIGALAVTNDSIKANELLVGDIELLRYTERQFRLTEEERDKLWEDLIDGFTLYDRTLIIDSLDQGAPSDRCNRKTGEYPIHMAT